MTADIPTMDPFAQTMALDGVPLSRALSRDDLLRLQAALHDFKAALAAWEVRREAEREKARAEREKQRRARLHPVDQQPAEQQPAEQQPAESPPSTSPQAATAPGVHPEEFHCLVVAGYLGGDYGPGQQLSTEEAVALACEQHFGAGSPGSGYPFAPRLERIHVVLDSGGGSLDSAYKAVLYLRRFARDIQVHVPSRAKSAATLIAIGADRIVMSPYAELGPLDTQIKDPGNPSTHISALDCYRSVDYVREFGVQTISRALTVMLAETQAMVPLSDLIRTATDFAVGSVRPMLEQVKALDFGAWGRTLKIGETYARALRMRLHRPDSEEAAEQLARKLVYGYTHHPYPIDLVEVEELGLKVDTMPADVYAAAREISRACREEARFVGFSEDVSRAIDELEELQDGTSRTAVVPAARQGADVRLGAEAHLPSKPERRSRRMVPNNQPPGDAP